MFLDTLMTLLTRMAARGSVFIVLLILALQLTTSEIGYYGLIVTTSYAFVFLLNLGFRHSIAFYVAKDILPLPTLIPLMGLYSLFTCIFAYFISNIVFRFIFSDTDPEYLVNYGSVIFIPMVLNYIVQGVFIGQGKISVFNKSEIVSKNFLLISTLLVMVSGVNLSLRSALIILFTSNVLGLIYSLHKVYSDENVGSLNFSISAIAIPHLKRMLTYGFPLTLAMSFSVLAPTACLMILKQYLTVEDVGIFFLAYKLTDIVSEAATSAGMVIFSRAVRAKSANESLVSSFKMAKILGVLSVFFIIITLPIVYYFSQALEKDRTELFFLIIATLSFSLPFLCFSKIANSALSAHSYSRYCLYNQAVCFCICVCICIFTVGELNIYAAVVSLIVSRFIGSVVYIFIYSKVLLVSPLKLIFGFMVK